MSKYMGLFPPLTPFSSGFLPVGNEHELYWEQSGNPQGVPVVLIHGGPGAGSSAIHRQFFDPDFYRIILFDQRGSGRSQPLGSLEHNTTEHLIKDLEHLRTHLSIERWHLFGGSWGSTLTLSYAAQHPQRCMNMILRGIFLLEQDEVDWWLYGIKTIFPEAWEQFASGVPEKDRSSNLLAAYHSSLTSADETIQMDAAIRWCLYESACSSLIPNYESITTDEQKAQALALARIECHYFSTQIIAPDDSLLKRVDAFRAVPATIIQGRYDIVCPIQAAHKLHSIWPEADYIVVPDGGHSALDPAIRSRLIEATENAKTLVI